jgi:hypothetical protein
MHTMTEKIPELITNPLPNVPQTITDPNIKELWQAVQRLQLTINQLILVIAEEMP